MGRPRKPTTTQALERVMSSAADLEAAETIVDEWRACLDVALAYALEAGASVTDLAEALDVSTVTVYDRARRGGWASA